MTEGSKGLDGFNGFGGSLESAYSYRPPLWFSFLVVFNNKKSRYVDAATSPTRVKTIRRIRYIRRISFEPSDIDA